MAELRIDSLTKRYPDGHEAVRDVGLTVRPGEFLVVLGPSGSGKTTLMRLVAGLERPTSGEIRLDDRRIDHLPPRDRDVAMVSQEGVVFPHLNVFDNLAFGLKARRQDARTIRDRVESVAESLGLSGVLGARPAALSGGQRRRVALGRALVRRPKLFLFDEPLTNLDRPLKLALEVLIRDLQRREGITTLFVTHDQEEAFALGERLAVLIDGKLQQVGTRAEIEEMPARRSVAAFVGEPPMNVIPGQASWVPSGRFVLDNGEGWALPGDPGVRPDGPAALGVRPEDLVPDDSGVPGRIIRSRRYGPSTTVAVDLGPVVVQFQSDRRDWPIGETVRLAIRPWRVVWFGNERFRCREGG